VRCFSRSTTVTAYSLCPVSSDKYEEQRRHWGGGLRGNKSTQMLRKRAKAAGQNVAAASLGKL
jgi:hypothetical protein